eukprot:6181946-Pleurochrysis_carterae.AAC.5
MHMRLTTFRCLRTHNTCAPSAASSEQQPSLLVSGDTATATMCRFAGAGCITASSPSSQSPNDTLVH